MFEVNSLKVIEQGNF